MKVLQASVLLYIQCMVYTQLLGGMTQLLARLPRNHSGGSSNPFKAFLPIVSLSKKPLSTVLRAHGRLKCMRNNTVNIR